MKVDCLIAEIGSTTTTVNVFDHLDHNPIFLGQGIAPTTIEDVRIGLQNAILDYEIKTKNKIEPRLVLASSSAAGGLKMSVHGLVYDMTVKAAKEAALGAGANVKMVTSGILNDSELEEIKKLQLNIIMIAGGVDYGENETALENAKRIANLKLGIPVLYAGNCVNHVAVREAFRLAGEESHLLIGENVYPKIDEINIEGVRQIIHRIFEEHITEAKGMSHIRQMVDGIIIPTPGAVYEACRLLHDQIGEIICCDIGGATTDVVSIGEAKNTDTNVSITPEPFAKRTVEGDLGVYINRYHLVKLIGEDVLCRALHIDQKELNSLLENYLPIPDQNQIALTERLTYEALKVGIRRHAGFMRYSYQGKHYSNLIEGKDLRRIKNFVATGGALTQLPNRMSLIKNYLMQKDGSSLKPEEGTTIWIDQDYILASCGVLAKVNPKASLILMLKSIGWEE